MAALKRTSRALRWTAVLLMGAFLVALPAGGAGPKQKRLLGAEKFVHFSQSVAVSYWAANPKAAPAPLRRMAAALEAAESGSARQSGGGRAAKAVFNDDDIGFPQNEESITACKTNSRIVLGGTNDFRGLIEDPPSVTGWHYSNDGGRSLRNEGRLPPVALLSDPSREIPSGGDPVDVAGTTNAAGTAPGCAFLYASSLAFNLEDPFGDANGIALYRTTPAILESCGGGTDPSCWPVRRLVAEAGPSHFLDKEWFDVGRSGAAGEVVWVVYADFVIDPTAPLGFTAAEIFAVRCDRDLVTCTAPIPISVDDGDVQFADVTIAPDGRVYVTWSEIIGELPTDPEFPTQTFVHKLRIAEPGSLVFGPERIVAVEEKAIPFGGFLHANDFRVATYPKNDVAMVGGSPRIFVVWDACKFRPLDFVCEEALIKLTFSDDDGVTWTNPMVISRGGDNYFPSIVSNDAGRKPMLAFAWFSNQRDTTFHNRQDVVFAAMDPAKLKVMGLRNITSEMNESEADPLLGGFFIGDYIEVNAVGNNAWVHYNANYRMETLLGPFGVEGIPVPQQDNYLEVLRLSGAGG